jgi:tripeptidyl-peptidase-1
VPEAYARRVCAGFAQLAARGISVLFSSGDHGVGLEGYCHSNGPAHERKFLPAFPATCPWVTSVGVTRGFSPETATYVPEMSSLNLVLLILCFRAYFASGGGFNEYFEAPSYQKSTVDKYVASLDGLHASRFNANGRAYPDVAAQG